MTFSQRKKDILSKEDKSSIGEWDKHIVDLCDKLNGFDNYYTTSSCSGRVVLVKDQDNRESGMFGFVSHDLVDFDEFMNNLHLLLTNKLTESKQISSGFSLNNKVKEEGLVESNLSKAGNGLKSINFKFKQEPPILHVVCKSLEDAESLLKKAQLVGFKRSGAISLSGNIVVELISTEKIEFPLLKDGNLLVREDFLRFVIQKSNENLEKGWKKVENLKNSLE